MTTEKLEHPVGTKKWIVIFGGSGMKSGLPRESRLSVNSQPSPPGVSLGVGLGGCSGVDSTTQGPGKERQHCTGLWVKQYRRGQSRVWTDPEQSLGEGGGGGGSTQSRNTWDRAGQCLCHRTQSEGQGRRSLYLLPPGSQGGAGPPRVSRAVTGNRVHRLTLCSGYSFGLQKEVGPS